MRRGLLAAVLATATAFPLVGYVCFLPIWDSDAGWHLAVGRLIENAGIPRTNALSWTAPDQPWYATSWLFDLIAHALVQRMGPLGLQLFVAALLLVALFAWAVALRLVDPMGPWLLPAGALAILPRITHRPQVATFAVLALVAALGLRGRRRGVGYRLACAAVVALFGNLHAGAAFAAGVAGLFCLEEFVRTRRPRELAAAAVCGLAVLANPGMLYNAGYLLAHLHVQTVVELKEFLPATLAKEPVFFAAVPLAIAAVFLRRREAGLALPAAFAVLAVLGVRANREAYDAMIVAVPLLALGLDPVRARTGARGAALLAVLCALSAAAAQGYPRAVFDARFGARWNDRVLPVRAARFIEAEHLSGRRFNGLRDGGYLEMALPADPSFADGRIQAWPAEFWRQFEEAEKTSASFRRWLRTMGAEWAVTTRVPERLGGHRQMDAPDWALVYWDQASEVWLRRDVPRFAALVERAEYRHFKPYGAIIGAVGKTPRADLRAFVAEVKRFEETAPGDPFALLVKCALATRLASPERGLICDDAAAVAPPSLVEKARALPEAG